MPTYRINHLEYFQQFSELNSNLLLFSGSLYFTDAEEQTAYCQLTGYIVFQDPDQQQNRKRLRTAGH